VRAENSLLSTGSHRCMAGAERSHQLQLSSN
jgi:hypothetical protein